MPPSLALQHSSSRCGLCCHGARRKHALAPQKWPHPRSAKTYSFYDASLLLQGVMPTPAELAEQKRLAEARDKIVKALVSEIMVGSCARDFHRRRMASQQAAPVVPPPQLNSILNAICCAVFQCHLLCAYRTMTAMPRRWPRRACKLCYSFSAMW